MSAALSRRVGLVSCVKEKAPSARPARELYVSDYFTKMQRHVEATCDEWRILSAQHGLVHPEQVLEPYEQTLAGASRPAQRVWADHVFTQIRTAFPNAEAVIFEVHAGAEYSRVLVPQLQAAGYRVDNPAAGLRIGERLRWYLQNDPRQAAMRPGSDPDDNPAATGMARAAAREPSVSVRQPPSALERLPRPQRGSVGRPTTADFERELQALFAVTEQEGRSFADFQAGALHRRVGGYPGANHALPTCCTVMRRTMGPADLVLEEPPKGRGANLLIRYQLPR